MLNKNDEIKINKAIDGIIIEISERLPKEDKELKIAFEETEQITYGIVKNRINNLLSDLELYLQTEALKKEIFSTSENQVIFYKKNLFKKVKEENKFDMTQKIKYKKGEELEKNLKEAGIIFATSGVVSIIIPSIVPVSIGLVIAGVLYYNAKKSSKIRKNKFNEIIKEYLKNLKISLQKWVESVDKYYENEINKLEEEIKNSKEELKDGKE